VVVNGVTYMDLPMYSTKKRVMQVVTAITNKNNQLENKLENMFFFLT